MPLSPEYHHHLDILKLLVHIWLKYRENISRDKISIAIFFQFHATLLDPYIYRDAEITKKKISIWKAYKQNSQLRSKWNNLITNTTTSQLILYNYILKLF